MSDIITNFHFLRPLFLLVFVPLALVIWQAWRIRRNSRSWQEVCDPALLPYLLSAGEKGVSHSLGWLVAAAAALGILAAAGPVWKQFPQAVFETESALIVALDLSRSMDATDIKPSRLSRARHKVMDILDSRREGQTALLVYAGDAFVVSPLTDDTATIRSLLDSIDTSMMPKQGSRPDLVIKQAITMFRAGGAVDGQLLLLADAVDDSPALNDAVKGLLERGHRMAVLAVGSVEGAPIPLAKGGFLKDQDGSIVIPRVDLPSMREWSRIHQLGFAALTTDDSDLKSLLAAPLSAGRAVKEQRPSDMLKTDRWQEEGPWLLLLALPLFALCFRRGWLLSLVLIASFASSPVEAMEWKDLWQTPDQQARQQFEQKDYEQASLSFESRDWKAAALFREGKYQKSVETLEGIDTPDSLYNKGNALAKMGQYADALKAYDQALEKNPEHEDTLFNRKLVEDAMKQQPEKKNQGEDKEGEKGKEGSKQGEQDKGKQEGSDQGTPEKGAQGEHHQSDAKSEGNKGEASESGQKPEPQSDAMNEQGKGVQQNQSQAEADKDRSAQSEEQAGGAESKREGPLQRMSPEQLKQQESEQANEAWLRRIPDDPGGLMRRKFQYQYQQRNSGVEEEGKSW